MYNSKAIYERRHKLESKMKTLISAAMDKMDATELLELMYEKCCDHEQRNSLREKMIDLTVLENGIYIKVDSLQQREKINDFVGREIYPSYNEQQCRIFLY